MATLNLFFLCVLIWGSTWIAIKFQLGTVAPEVSLFYRFLLASAILFAFCWFKKLPLRFTPRQHALLALQGTLMFSISYIFVYHAEMHVVSGLVAVGYSASPLLNMLVVRVFYGTPMSLRVTLGALLGIAGIVIIFWPEFATLRGDGNVALGSAFTAIAVIISAVASGLVTRNSHHGLPVWQTMTWGMFYGTMALLLISLVTGRVFELPLTFPYISSLLYLSIFGSIVAFAAYYTLLHRIGAGRAGYIGVMVPVIALFISAMFEGFRWQLATWAGIALSFAGNVIVLRQSAQQRP
ncbi:MAG: EamA family transporter [Betaproteobacteria bacterium]|nr:EamA family transporter [Betaproteobacteria bacterium]